MANEPLSTREFHIFTSTLYDAQANLEAKLRVVTAIHVCADRFTEGEAGADALQEIHKHVESLSRLNATGSEILKLLNSAIRNLIVASSGSSSPAAGV